MSYTPGQIVNGAPVMSVADMLKYSAADPNTRGGERYIYSVNGNQYTQADQIADRYQGALQRAANAKYQAGLNDPNATYTFRDFALGPDGQVMNGDNDFNLTDYRREGDYLVPVSTTKHASDSGMTDFLHSARDSALMAGGVIGGGMLLGGALGAGAGSGALGSSAVSNAALAESAAGTGLAGVSSATPGYVEAFNAALAAGAADPSAAAMQAVSGSNPAPYNFADNYGTVPEAGPSGPPTASTAPTPGELPPDPSAAADPYVRTSADRLAQYGADGYGEGSSIWDKLGNGASDWIDKLMKGDPTALRQAQMGLSGAGALARAFGYGDKGGNQLSPGQLGAQVQSKYNNWTPAQQATMDQFNQPLKPFQFVKPNVFSSGRQSVLDPMPTTGGVAGRINNQVSPDMLLHAYADGGRIEPVIGTYGPRRQGGTGGGLSRTAVADVAAGRAPNLAPQDMDREVPRYNGLSFNTNRALKALDKDEENYAQGGHVRGCLCNMCSGGAVSRAMGGGLGYVAGDSPGQADDVDARLSHGEYVFDADTVSALGDGNNAAGAGALDQMREEIRRHKRSAPASKIPPKAHAPMAYLKKGR